MAEKSVEKAKLAEQAERYEDMSKVRKHTLAYLTGYGVALKNYDFEMKVEQSSTSLETRMKEKIKSSLGKLNTIFLAESALPDRVEQTLLNMYFDPDLNSHSTKLGNLASGHSSSQLTC